MILQSLTTPNVEKKNFSSFSEVCQERKKHQVKSGLDLIETARSESANIARDPPDENPVRNEGAEFWHLPGRGTRSWSEAERAFP